MRAQSYGGYRLTARRPASSAAVEHWWAEGPDGLAEVYLGPDMLVRRARALPVWGPFAAIVTGREGPRSYVVVKGRLGRGVDELRKMLSPGACVAFAWHLASALAEVHEHGGAHGALHPGWTGVDSEGRLTIRPALSAAVRSDPDGDASAQASDCIQLASILDALELERLDESALTLMMRGVSRERSRLRLQPGRAVRQSLSYILGRHPEWEASLVDTLGADWRTTIIPRSAALPEPVASPPWMEHGTHIPRVGGSSVPAASVSVDLRSGSAGIPVGVPVRAAAVAVGQPAAAVEVEGAPERSARARVEVLPASSGIRVSLSGAAAPFESDAASSEEAAQPSEPAPAAARLAAPEQASDEPPTAIPEPPEAAPSADAGPTSEEPPSATVEEVPVAAEDDAAAEAPIADGAPTEDEAVEADARVPMDAPMESSPDEPAYQGAPPSLFAELADSIGGPSPVAPRLAGDDPAPIPVVVTAEPVSDDPSSADEVFEDDEKTAVTSVPEPVKRALLQMDAERNLREPTQLAPPPPEPVPEPITEVAPAPSITPPPSFSPPVAVAPVEVEPDDGAAPRWAGIKGVTGDASREDELGSGKWEEDARPLDELRKEMGATPVRPMEEIDPSRGNWAMLAVAIAALVGLVALWFATQGSV